MNRTRTAKQFKTPAPGKQTVYKTDTGEQENTNKSTADKTVNGKAEAQNTNGSSIVASETDKTAGDQLKPYQFKPGQSGNINGRPKGSRNKLSEAFLAALYKDFKAHGAGVIEQVREKQPDKWLSTVASLVPKEFQLSLNEQGQVWVINAQPTDSIDNWASQHGIAIEGESTRTDIQET